MTFTCPVCNTKQDDYYFHSHVVGKYLLQYCADVVFVMNGESNSNEYSDFKLLLQVNALIVLTERRIEQLLLLK